MEQNKHFVPSLLKFLDSSPSNFLAVKTAKTMLREHGFKEFQLHNHIDAKAGDRFYVTKNDSALFAFVIGAKHISDTGFRVIAAHSDSPGFRIKPSAEILTDGNIVKLNTEVYGGPILYTWFDRPLSLSGRVLLRGEDPLHPITEIIKIDRPILQIPHLAIHLNREVNAGNPLSKQKDMLPIIAKVNDALEKDGLILRLIAKHLNITPQDIIDFDLTLYDTTPACTFGVNNEFISAGRLDDLSMAHAALEAIVRVPQDYHSTCVTAIFDNEETGSGTKQGAGSPVLANLMQVLVEKQGGKFEDFCIAIQKSFMISADNAHAFHPNYTEKYDPTNHPVLGGGPVIKINANCKYMSDGHSAAIFRALCDDAEVPCQYFVNHSDQAGGSTLGNILTKQIDIEGVDVGNPLLAMHSVRETGSGFDHEAMTRVFIHFFSK